MRFLFIFVLCGAFSLAAQPQIQFEKTTHIFGDIIEGEMPTYNFVVKNTGTDSLKVIQVIPSCGCTEPQWSKAMIAPNQTGVITIGYNSTGRPGRFDKSIQVISNANPSSQEIRISGEVIPRQITNGIQIGNLLFNMNNSFLGGLKVGETLSQKFYVQNKGTRPIRIQEAVWTNKDNIFVSYPQRPIFAGEVVMIEVAFNSSDVKLGYFKETILLKTNDTQEREKTITIEANVIE